MSGKCLVGDLSIGGLSICPQGSVRQGKCLVGEMSGRGPVRQVTIRRGTVYLSGICPWGSVRRVSVQSGKCPVTHTPSVKL